MISSHFHWSNRSFPAKDLLLWVFCIPGHFTFFDSENTKVEVKNFVEGGGMRRSVWSFVQYFIVIYQP